MIEHNQIDQNTYVHNDSDDAETSKRIPLLLVTHGHLGAAFIEAMEDVAGIQKDVKSFHISAEDDLDEKKEELACILRNYQDRPGVLILTDMFGGIPSNMAMSEAGVLKNVELISGVNLPMLVKLVNLREKDVLSLHELALEAENRGRHYINLASNVLKSSAGKA